MKNLWTRKAIDVDRVLLVNYPKIFDAKSLKEESDVSPARISEVSTALIHRNLAVHSEGKYRLKLTAPSTLLNEWATIRDFTSATKFVDYYSPEQDISKFLETLKDIKTIRYALTGLAGALLVAPFVRPTNVHIYVKNEKDAEDLANLLDLVPVEANGNVKFAIAESSEVFYGAEERDGVCVVSLPQLYVDLYNYPARGREAAREVYKVIEDKWEARKASINV
jgi:hypothetical protein